MSLLDPNTVGQLKEAPRLSDQVYALMHESIAAGKLKPGAWLREEALTQELGVSRATVRDVLTRLVAEGLAIHEPYRGVRVASFSVDDLDEVYTMRQMLEGWALELAADRITDDELAQMRALLPQTAADPNPLVAQAARDANHAFHWIAIRASGRPHLIRILEQLWKLMPTYILRQRPSDAPHPAGLGGDLGAHTAILKALEAHDGTGARQAIVTHLAETLQTLRSELERKDSTQSA